VRFEDTSHASINRATLNHWMEAMAGDDIRRNLGTEGPTGLASEPADPARCFAAAKLVAPRSFFNQIRYDRVQVTEKCRQLHEAVKAQALAFLISAHWATTEAEKRGLSPGAADVRSALARERRRLYPTAAALHRYLTERHWSLSDLLFQLKLALIASGPRARPVKAPDGLPTPADSRYVKLQDRSRTICARGYLAPGCRGYDFRDPAAQAESVVAELTARRAVTSPPPR
jgi:hypothetical protein